MIGQVIGNYKIEQKLGEGGMGAVYKGVDTMLDREVAIKALRPELASQTAVVERFRSEAVTLAKLNHPNIASLYSLFRQGEELYMVLEFVRGETLDNILQRRGALPAEEAIPVFCQVLDGIDHAHEFGIVHRDIKPANMMLTENGKLKVLDFGIARLLGSARMTRAGNIIGTLEYMAPEQVKGLETDARSDIYALGMMLYEILTGRLAFDTENEFELMKKQTEEMPPRPSEINPDIPEEVDEAIMRAIQKDPDERFQTAGEFMETLLDAGYSKIGAMHGTTGSHKMRPNTKPSRPAISQSGASVSKPGTEESAAVSTAENVKSTRLGAPIAPLSGAEVKATLLGASVATASTAAAAKATRLGVSNEAPVAAETEATHEAAPSFFSKLTPVHYVGAGVAGLVLLGLLIGVPLMMLSGGKTNDAKVVEKPVVEVKEQRPEVITLPQQPAQTAIQQPAAPPPTQGAADLNGIAPGTTISEQPAQTGSKPAEKARDTAAQKPAAPPAAQKPAAPKPATKPAAPKPAAKKPSAECLLTGDC